MSVHVSSAVWKIEGVTPTDKLILLKLADHANDDGECWPSIRRMVRETCLAKTTVCRRLRELEADGVIVRIRRGGTSTLYRLDLTKISKTLIGGGGPVAGQCSEYVVPPRDRGGPTTGPPVVPPRDQNHHIEPSREPSPFSGRKVRSDRTEDELALARLVQPDMLASDVFRRAWTEWQGWREERHRRPLTGEKRQPWTERAAQAALRNMLDLSAKYGDAKVAELVARAIDRRWLEVYAPRAERSNAAAATTDQLHKF